MCSLSSFVDRRNDCTKYCLPRSCLTEQQTVTNSAVIHGLCALLTQARPHDDKSIWLVYICHVYFNLQQADQNPHWVNWSTCKRTLLQFIVKKLDSACLHTNTHKCKLEDQWSWVFHNGGAILENLHLKKFSALRYTHLDSSYKYKTHEYATRTATFMQSERACFLVNCWISL